jgi:hypothetical protein
MDRVVDANVWKISVLTELVDGPRPDGELLGDLGDAKQAVSPAPEHLQVGERQDSARKSAAEEKSTPETLTTACHAASWLARS